MEDSGYNAKARVEILKSAVTKFRRQVLEEATGGRNIFRGAKDMKETRRYKDFYNKAWFRSERGGWYSEITKIPHGLQRQRRTGLGDQDI